MEGLMARDPVPADAVGRSFLGGAGCGLSFIGASDDALARETPRRRAAAQRVAVQPVAPDADRPGPTTGAAIRTQERSPERH
jgi:hypothetical protein